MLNGLGGKAEVEQAVEVCQRSGAPSVRHHGADLSDPQQISEMFGVMTDTFGAGPDVVVNNAGKFVVVQSISFAFEYSV